MHKHTDIWVEIHSLNLYKHAYALIYGSILYQHTYTQIYLNLKCVNILSHGYICIHKHDQLLHRYVFDYVAQVYVSIDISVSMQYIYINTQVYTHLWYMSVPTHGNISIYTAQPYLDIRYMHLIVWSCFYVGVFASIMLGYVCVQIYMHLYCISINILNIYMHLY